MAWLLSSPQINSAFASLGRYESDTYIVNDDCLKTLDGLITRITMEDYTVRSMRRSVGFSQNIQNDLVPLLIHTNDQRVFERTVKFLELLTIPVECLLSVHLMEKTDVGRTTMYELNQLLIKCKASLVDLKCIAAITDYMNGILEKNSTYTPEQCENILNCLMLLRNIMYIPEQNDSTVLQNQLIWNLFFKNFGKLLIHLQTCSQRSYWSVAMVELTALMYKDQHVTTLQRLLRASFEDSMNESSEDNESNTTMPKNRSMDSSPLLTSSDSSDNGGRGKKMNEDSAKDTATTKNSLHPKHITAYQQSDDMSCSDESNAPKSQKKGDKFTQHQNSTDMSDCGYGTQVDTPENQCTSSSSNDDDNMQHQVHHKPPQNQKQRHNPANKAVDNQNKQELRKKRLLKRAKTNM
jgi:timeless